MKSKFKLLAVLFITVTLLPSCMVTKCRYNSGWRIENNFGKEDKQISFQAKKAEKNQQNNVKSSFINEPNYVIVNNPIKTDSTNLNVKITDGNEYNLKGIEKKTTKRIHSKKMKSFNNLDSKLNEEKSTKNNASEGTNSKDNYIGDYFGGIIDGLLIIALVLLFIAVIFLIIMLVQVAMVDWVLALILLGLIILDLLFLNGELTMALLSSM